MVHQIKGLDGIIESGSAVVGGTGSVGQSMGVNSRDWAILVSDVGCKLGILGALTMSACLPATMTVVAALSLGRSVSATTIGPALLLLWGKFGVHLLALYSAKLVGLGGLATATTRGTFLLKGESGCLDDSIQFQGLHLAGQDLAEDLSYDLHSGRELAKNDHRLHVGRELEASVLEICKVAQHLCDHRSRMGASENGH